MAHSKNQGRDQDWSITLTPHRSLSRTGFRAIMAVLVLANLFCALFFLSLKAWPVFGFMGLDLALVWWAFRRNFSDSRVLERIIATGDQLRLERHAADAPLATQDFNRRWVAVELEYDEGRELVGRLFLRSHGKRHEIAGFLGADERQSLARALRGAI